MLATIPWIVPLAVILSLVFVIGFMAWLDSAGHIDSDAGQLIFGVCIFFVVLSLGSLITLLVI